MKLHYDTGEGQSEIVASDDMINSLISYAANVLVRMQKAEPEHSDCWTACTITFEDLTPVFHWSSIEDMDYMHVIQVTVPVGTALPF